MQPVKQRAMASRGILSRDWRNQCIRPDVRSLASTHNGFPLMADEAMPEMSLAAGICIVVRAKDLLRPRIGLPASPRPLDAQKPLRGTCSEAASANWTTPSFIAYERIP